MAKSKTAWEQASDWFARTLAIVGVMVAPGALGAWLDGRIGTSFLAAAGFVLGMVLAIGLLMLFTRIKAIDNDGAIMKSTGSSLKISSLKTAPPHSSATPSPMLDRFSNPRRPSEQQLPEMPGADVLEEVKRDE
jgi:hypothetical protein